MLTLVTLTNFVSPAVYTIIAPCVTYEAAFFNLHIPNQKVFFSLAMFCHQDGKRLMMNHWTNTFIHCTFLLRIVTSEQSMPQLIATNMSMTLSSAELLVMIFASDSWRTMHY